MTERILIVDPDDAPRESLELILAGKHYEVQSASNSEAALELIESVVVDVVLCDFRVAGLDGLDLLPQIARRHSGVPILLTGACGNQELALEAMRRGAYDSITKPFQPHELQLKLRNAREREGLRRSGLLLARDIVRAIGERPIVAATPAMIELLESMERTAGSKTPALLSGEKGTEKEVLARTIHAQSPRRDGPFVVVSCGAFREEALLEGELFGHAKGVVSDANHSQRGRFVEANDGCIFLDDVAELPKTLQAKLLRVLQEEEIRPIGETKTRRVNARVISATSRDLEADSRTGAFLPDLHDRLSAVHLFVPPLRDRRRDIPLLVDHFMARSRRTLGRGTMRMGDTALERLTQYSWPGNVRELENVIERAMILSDGDRITLRQLPADVVAARGDDTSSEPNGFSLKSARRIAEAEVIERALSATRGNRTHAAKLLGISHRALLYKIKDYQVRN